MTTCARCHRPLRREPIFVGGSGYGPRCAQEIAGFKPRRIKREDRRSADERQAPLFDELQP